MLRQDSVSRGSIVVVVASTLLIILLSASFDPLLMPIFLLVGAVTLRVYANRRVKVDTEISQRERKETTYYVLLALAGLALTGVMVQGLWMPPTPAQLLPATTLTIAFSAIMAVVETQYFQGELLPIISRKYTFGVGILAVSGLGVVYHLQHYGTNPQSLMYVAFGFAILSWVAWRTKRVLPAIIAHVINNVGGFFLPNELLFGAAVVFAVFFVVKKNGGKQLW